jgi:glycosyltransferase involved in cell wall biosynthesis
LRVPCGVPKVSVVIPLYNKAPWVRASLDSIARQTEPDFEAIVVDDGSTDEGADIVGRYPDRRFRLVRQPNAGPGAARNRGIAEARSGVLAFLDADDEWLPGFLDAGLRALAAAGPDVAATVCGYVLVPSGADYTELFRRRGVRDGIVRLRPDDPPLHVVHHLAYMCPWSTIVRAAVVRRYGGFFDRGRCLYAEDAFLWLQVLLNEAVQFRMESLVRYNTGASGLARNADGSRPIEPFLRHPELIEAACPPALRPLLDEVLAIRAFKTACVLSYWGRWREARALVHRFGDGIRPTLPWALAARVAATPAGALAGSVARAAGARLAALRGGSEARAA